MINYARLFVASIGFFGLLSVSNAQSLVDYQNNIFGLSMRIPAGMQISTTSLEQGGWSRFTGSKQPVTIIAQRKDTLFSEPGNMIAFLVAISGVPASVWKLVDQGVNQRGWTKFQTYEANDGKNLIDAVMGNGMTRSYMVFLSTTIKDFTANKAAYDAWYTSLTLVPVVLPPASTPTPPVTPPAQTSQSSTQPAQMQSAGTDTLQTKPASQPAGPATPKKQPANQKAKYQ